MAGLRASEIGPLEAEGVVWHETGQIFSILVRRGKGSGQDVRLPLDRPVSRMLGVWLATRPAGRFLWGRPLTRGAVRNIFLERCGEVGIAATGRRLSRTSFVTAERGRRKKVVPVRPALEQLLGELRGLVRST